MNAQQPVLVKSRRGGKMHYESCGSRSRYVTPISESARMTHQEKMETYKDMLCTSCFPELKK